MTSANAPLTRRTVRLIAAAFLATGFSALLYQVVWQRMLGLFTGSDVYAAAIITGAFLFGLGVGSLIGGAVADRMAPARVMALFGWCNLGIAAFALASRALYYDVLYRQLQSQPLSLPLLLLIVGLSLLVPTVLMGLSLPLLARAVVQNLTEAASQIGRLYALNTLGAGLGTLLGGWLIVGSVGYEPALWLGAALSAAAGLAALALAGQFSRQAPPPERRTAAGGLWGWAALVFTSGFVSISLEVVAFRILLVAMSASAYTFGHFLAFVLLGDALGAALGARAAGRVARPRRAFLAVLTAAVVYALGAGLLLYLLLSSNPLLADLARFDAGSLQFSGAAGVGAFIIVYVLLPALLLLPPNILLGYYFPLVQKAVQTQQGAVGQRVGLLSLANIFGNAAGSLFTGLVALHLVGTSGTLMLIGAVGVAFAAWLAWQERGAVRWGAAAAAGALVAMMLAFPAPVPWWRALMGFASTTDAAVVEDASGVVLLEFGASDGLFVDGVNQGYIPFFFDHVYAGVVPALAHPNPRRAFVIGIGSGGTPYTVGANPALEQIVAVEIVGAELPILRQQAERRTESPLRAFFADPRVQIIVGDGRHELAQSAPQFDLIQADAIQTWRSGAGLLYSREYFEEVRRRLAPGGLMAQWAPSARTRATFMAVFPYGVDVGRDILIGADAPVAYDPARIAARLDEPTIAAYLDAGQIDRAALGAEVLAHTPTFWTPETPRPAGAINTDLFPRDEYFLNNP